MLNQALELTFRRDTFHQPDVDGGGRGGRDHISRLCAGWRRSKIRGCSSEGWLISSISFLPPPSVRVSASSRF